MNIPRFLKQKKDQTRAVKSNNGFGDAYQDSLNKLGKEQFVKMVSRGIQMPGLAA